MMPKKMDNLPDVNRRPVNTQKSTLDLRLGESHNTNQDLADRVEDFDADDK